MLGQHLLLLVQPRAESRVWSNDNDLVINISTSTRGKDVIDDDAISAVECPLSAPFHPINKKSIIDHHLFAGWIGWVGSKV